MVVDRAATGNPGFVVESRQEGTAVVLTVRGELDLVSAPALRGKLHDATAGSPGEVVVDLERLDFLDSTGISVLVDALKRAEDAGGRMRLRSPTPAVRRVLEVTGLLGLFGLDAP